MSTGFKVLKTIFSWAAIALGAFFLLGCLFNIASDPKSAFGAFIFAVSMIFCGGWWLWCEHKDKINSRAAGVGIMGVPQTKVKRNWKVAAPAVAVSALIGLSLLGSSQQKTTAASAPETSTTTSTTSKTSSKTTTTSSATTSSSETSEPSSTEQSPEPEPAPENQVAAEAPAEEAAPAHVVEPAQQEAPVQEEAPVRNIVGNQNSGGPHYANCCAVWKAGAAPLYVDSPGYSEKLDKDKDGIACETPPKKCNY